MKRILSSIILISILLVGCGTYNLNYFVVPDDVEFMNTVAMLDTPLKIAQYMVDNFTYEFHGAAYTPHRMWQEKVGDCNDYAVFGVFVARFHGYEAEQVYVWYENLGTHVNAVYKIEDFWVLTDCWVYFEKFLSIEEAIIYDANYFNRTLVKFKILE